MKVERVECGLIEAVILRKLGVEPLERLEVLSLVSVIERLTEIEIPQVRARHRIGGQRHRRDNS